MYYDINNIQTMKEMVQNLFQELQIVYQNIFISLLYELDDWLMNNVIINDLKIGKDRSVQLPRCLVILQLTEENTLIGKLFTVSLYWISIYSLAEVNL